jgi:hypothetical protein
MIIGCFPDLINVVMPLSSPEATRFNRSRELERLFGKRAIVYSVARVDHPSAGIGRPVKAPMGFEHLAPYDIAIVEFPSGERRTFMGMFGERFAIGDEVECVVGRFAQEDTGIIAYRIKIRHPVTPEKVLAQ